MLAHAKRRAYLGAVVLIGTASAWLFGSRQALAFTHDHCNSKCKDIGCAANHEGFQCGVLDDNNCWCYKS